MKTALIVVVILILVLGGGILFLYYSYEKPVQEQAIIQMVNLSIYSTLPENNSFFENGYVVKVNNEEYQRGLTNEKGYTLVQVPANSSVIVYSENIRNYTFYNYRVIKYLSDFDGSNSQNQRINLILTQPGHINITKFRELNEFNIPADIYLNISSNGLFLDSTTIFELSTSFLPLSSNLVISLG